jgi:NADP-dependent 3-hydroxy acid dehydrogenase YdfG
MLNVLKVLGQSLLACALVPSLLAFADVTQPQKAVLITGASTGIGRLTAETLAGKGYLVYAGARKERDLQALSKIPNIRGVKLDVTSDADIAAAVQLIHADNTALWGLVNNAGINVIDPLIEVDMAEL